MKIKSIIMAILVASVLLMASPVLAGDKINVNTATVEQLQSVKGIGPKTAQAIVAYRSDHGDFKSVDELEDVKGIGEKKLDKIDDHLTVAKKKENHN